MKTYPESSISFEARRALVWLSLIVLAVWYGLLYFGRTQWMTQGEWTPYILPFWWTVLTVTFIQDKDCRFRLLYEGALGCVAYFLLHDVPHMLGFYWFQGELAHCWKLILTGFLAALPFGARGAGVSAVSGVLLTGLWFLYCVVGHGHSELHVWHWVSETFMQGFFLILMGGLLAERVTRSTRRHGDQGHPRPALWIVVTLVTLWQLATCWS